MPKMLPALPQAFGNLKDVFRSAADSLEGQANVFSFPQVRNAMVIMVDGLGWHNLNSHLGHAPFLGKHFSKSTKGYCSFPSTTAASIVSLASNQTPSDHGFIGYRVFDRSKSESVNLLTGLDEETVGAYIKYNLDKHLALKTVVVSRPEYRNSGFSLATFDSPNFLGESNLEKRFEAAANEINSGSGKIVYLYVPELDQAAHRFGSESRQWIELLELLDSLTSRLIAETTKGRGIVLTADHGVIDVPREGHIYLDECDALSDVLDVGGDPRACFIYFDKSIDVSAKQDELTEWLSGMATVHTMYDLIREGLYTAQVLTHSEIIPDLVVLAKSGRVCYHRGFAKPASLNMVGQHGGFTEQEIAVPILRFGDYSSSLLVP